MTDYDEYGLSGDLTYADFEEVVGMPYEEYVAPVVQRYAELPSGSDRNDILRSYFNEVAGPVGNRTDGGIFNFYSDPDGIYCKVCAYEIMCGQDTLHNLIRNGRNRVTLNPEFSESLALAERRFGKLAVLDHGCGPMAVGLYAVAERRAHVTFYDFATPMRNAILHAIRKYGSPDFRSRVTYAPVSAQTPALSEYGPFNYAMTLDVLEHVQDPIGELARIHAALLPGGVLLMNTFFNSCNGRDPQHLDEHVGLQETTLWFGEVERIGFRLIGRDPRGCEKVFERV